MQKPDRNDYIVALIGKGLDICSIISLRRRFDIVVLDLQLGLGP
jgi:hypothetical protein